MLEMLTIVLFCWIFCKAAGLAFRLAWGGTKLLVSALFAVAVPLFVGCLIFAGGLLLVVPLLMVAIAFALLKAVT